MSTLEISTKINPDLVDTRDCETKTETASNKDESNSIEDKNNNIAKHENGQLQFSLPQTTCTNVKLSDLADQFETVLSKVKTLELTHLIEPIQNAADKLRELENFTKQFCINCFDDCSRAKPHRDVPSAAIRPIGFVTPVASRDRTLETAGESGPEEFFDATSRAGATDSVDSCNCDDLPTTFCPRPRRRRRRRSSCYSCPRSRILEDKHQVVRGRLGSHRWYSNAKYEIEVNLKNQNLRLAKDRTWANRKILGRRKGARSRAYCPAESSTSTCESEVSSDLIPSKDFSSRKLSTQDQPIINKQSCMASISNLGACGCGQSGGPSDASTCPCRCGDTRDPSEDGPMPSSSAYYCDICGKRISNDSLNFEDFTKLFECETKNDDNDSQIGTTFNKKIKAYIQSLESKCREKDKIIKELRQASVESNKFINS